jgi:hypothetical protein
MISGLVALGLLLVPAAPTLATTLHQPDAVSWHHDCADTPCMPDAATGNDCCQVNGCALGFFISVVQAIAPQPSTSAQYWTHSVSSIGLTPEPDIGPPIPPA